MNKRIAFLAIIALAACGQSNKSSQTDAGNTIQATATPADWKTYKSDSFSIQYPAAWSLKEKYMGTQFVLLAPVDSSSPTFAENVNLATQDITGKEQDLDKIVPATMELLKTVVTNFNLLSNTRKKDASGVEYQQIIYTCNQGKFSLKQEQQYRIIHNEAYILTLTTLQDKWDSGYKPGEQIMGTFAVK